MNRFKKIAIYFIVVLITATLYDCAPTSKSLTIESGQIPENFKGYDKTLLVVLNNKAWNKIAMKHFKNNYRGKYIFVSADELNSKYNDVNEYRFAVNKTDYFYRSTGPTYTGLAAATEDMFMLDRATGKVYKTKISTSFFGILINRYTTALERNRTE